jgi:hypothetical protein
MSLIVVFSLLFTPKQGIIIKLKQCSDRKWQFAGEVLLVHLSQHEGTSEETSERSMEHLSRHMKWSMSFSDRVVAYLIRKSHIEQNDNDILHINSEGRKAAREVMLR